ncbi:PAC2 family protein [uncultured Gulosibacter sp.]|uniref:proteasome assembly chaperone family protein n=1 Tax=uncultured Gulosibacter sp. TaxID=1339167 RepID=UPI00288C4AEE|nr:PAC2 family protein [uncultured Gulosibacter sp.]
MSVGRLFKGERVLVCAMRGWSDAGDAASDAVVEVRKTLGLDHIVDGIDDERFYDYSATRPWVSITNGKRRIEWPHTVIYGPRPEDDHGIYVLIGDEPALQWQSYVEMLLDLCVTEGITAIVQVGSLLADTPHTRDIQVHTYCDDDELRLHYSFELSSYQGPLGVLSVFAEAASAEGIRSVALWASVPHYAQAPDLPAAKATLALTEELSGLLLFNFDREALREAADAWEIRVTQAVERDEDLGQYVQFLEQTRDMVDSEAASGEAIAAEFEAFLSTDADDRDDHTDGRDFGDDSDSDRN